MMTMANLGFPYFFYRKLLIKASRLRAIGLKSASQLPLLFLLAHAVALAAPKALQAQNLALNPASQSPFANEDFLNDELSLRLSNRQNEFKEQIQALEFSFSQSQVSELRKRLQNINRSLELREQIRQTESLIENLQERLSDLESTAPFQSALMEEHFPSANGQPVEIQGFQLPSKRQWLTKALHDFHLLAREVIREYDDFFPHENSNLRRPHLQNHWRGFEQDDSFSAQNNPLDPLNAHRSLVRRAIDRLAAQGHFVWFARYPELDQPIGPKHYIHQNRLFQEGMSLEQQQNYRLILYEQTEGIFVDEDKDPFYKTLSYNRKPHPFWDIRPVEEGDSPSIEQLFYSLHSQEISAFERAVRHYNKNRQTHELLSSLVHFDTHLPHTREYDLRRVFNNYCAIFDRFDEITRSEYPMNFLTFYNFDRYFSNPIPQKKDTRFHTLYDSLCFDLALVFHQTYNQRIQRALDVFIPAMRQLLTALQLTESLDRVSHLIIEKEEALSRLFSELERISGEPLKAQSQIDGQKPSSEPLLLTESVTRPINEFLYDLLFNKTEKINSLKEEISATQDDLQDFYSERNALTQELKQNPLGLAAQTAYLIEKTAQTGRLFQEAKKHFIKIKIADSNHSSDRSRLELQRIEERLLSLRQRQESLKARLREIAGAETCLNFETWLDTTDYSEESLQKMEEIKASAVRHAIPDELSLEEGSLNLHIDRSYIPAHFNAKDKLSNVINPWAKLAGLSFFKEEMDQLLSQWESDYGSGFEPAVFRLFPLNQDFFYIIQSLREEAQSHISSTSYKIFEIGRGRDRQAYIQSVKRRLSRTERALSELRLHIELRQSEYERAEQNLSSAVDELKQTEEEYKAKLPSDVLNFWRALWRPSYYESGDDLSNQLETADLKKERQTAELQKLNEEGGLLGPAPFLEKRLLELKLEVIARLTNQSAPSLAHLFNGILLEHYLASCFLCSPEERLDFQASRLKGKEAINFFKSLREDLLSSASYEGDIDFLKPSYESALAQSHHDGASLLYNRAAVSLFHPFLENRAQCYSGTLLFFVMSELADTSPSPRFAIFTEGHILPGFLRYDGDTLYREEKAHGPFGLGSGLSYPFKPAGGFLNRGQNSLYGIETTVKGRGLIHFGPPETVAGNLKIVNMYPFLLIEFLKSQIDNFPQLYEKLQESLESQGFLPQQINPTEGSERITQSAKNLLSATPFGFGSSDIPSGDRIRQAIPQETGALLYNLSGEEQDQGLRDSASLTQAGFSDDYNKLKAYWSSDEGQSYEYELGRARQLPDDIISVWLSIVKAGHIEEIRLSLDQGVNVNAKNSDGVTALYLAAQNGRADIVKLLLEYGADVNATTNYGVTALHFAAQNGRADIVKLLLEYGADVNATTNYGVTALHLAAQNGHAETAQLLLENGADVLHAEDNYGVTALHLAAQNGHAETAQLLLENGADVHAEDNYGRTALHLAAWSWQASARIVKLLLENGADIHAEDNYGRTALHQVWKR